MITKLDHIGIAVKTLAEHIPFNRDVLKLEMKGVELLDEQMVKVAVFKVGEVNIELLAPISEESPVTKFIEKRGEGMHHIAYQIENIVEGIEELKKKKILLIDETPRYGAHGKKITFINPESSCKVLTELTQDKE